MDANDIRTEYTYDQYKRPTQMRKVNNSTSEERRCERVDYFYDEGGGANTGRLTRMRWNWDASANPCTVPGTSKKAAFEETYAYTAAGRVAGKNIDYRYDYIGNVNLDASWTYDNEGRLTSQTYPARSGQTGTRRVITYTYDSMGRLEGVAQNWDNNPLTSTNIATSAQYNFQGALTSLNILGQTETRQYNTLGQLTRIQGAGINIEYQFSATANDGKITGQKNWATGEEVTYQYDALERLISAATESSAWGLSWSYDGFGNRLNQNVTKGTASTMSTLVDANTNRLSGFGYSYDNNGNLLTMPQQSASMAYDASNRMVTFTNQNDTESYQYAPDNKRVWRSNACQDGQGAKHPSFYYYSVFGQLLGEYCTISGSVTVKQENFHFGGRIVAKGDTPGAITSLTTDRLHSKGDGSTFFPYGETKSGTPTTGDSFATYSRDWTGLDYADQRWYAPGVGRFTTVDRPTRTTARSIQSSLYSYAFSEPIGLLDPSGLDPITVTFSICVTQFEVIPAPNGRKGPDGSPLFITRSRPVCSLYDVTIDVDPTVAFKKDEPELVVGPGHPSFERLRVECEALVDFYFDLYYDTLDRVLRDNIADARALYHKKFNDVLSRNYSLAAIGVLMPPSNIGPLIAAILATRVEDRFLRAELEASITLFENEHLKMIRGASQEHAKEVLDWSNQALGLLQ